MRTHFRPVPSDINLKQAIGALLESGSLDSSVSPIRIESH